jgi:uncharacterized protein (TIGR04222 family)
MDWLMNNPLVDMYGPLFLLVYGSTIVLTLIACRIATRRVDWSASMPLPTIPIDPDPHEIAYLRGGENEVTRSVIFSLVQKGLLRTTLRGTIERDPEKRDIGHLTPIERRAYDWFTSPYKASEIFRAGNLASELKAFCGSYEQRLQRESFLTTPQMRATAQSIVGLGTLLIIGLGGYKLVVALLEDRFNVGFLLLLCIAGVLLLVSLCRLPRISRRGLAYIQRVQLAFSRLKSQANFLTSKSHDAEPALLGYDPTLLLLVGIYGVGALADTPFESYQQSFRKAAAGDVSSSGSSCGSSCGSSDSSSSTGGDSGASCSSSSCSGGSCGGGGCGGGGCGG